MTATPTAPEALAQWARDKARDQRMFGDPAALANAANLEALATLATLAATPPATDREVAMRGLAATWRAQAAATRRAIKNGAFDNISRRIVECGADVQARCATELEAALRPDILGNPQDRENET